MKKFAGVLVVLGIAVAAFVIFTNNSTTAKEKVIVKEKQQVGDTEVKTKTTITPDKVQRETEMTPGVETKKGYLKHEKVTIKEVDEGNMYVTFIKDKKTYTKKYRQEAKDSLRKSVGKETTIYSTYPLDQRTCEIAMCE